MSLSSSSQSTIPLPTQRFKGSVNVNVATNGGMAGKGAVHINTTHMTNEERVKAFEAALEYQANSKSQEGKSCYAEGPNSMAGDGAIRIGPSRGLNAQQK